MGPRRDLPTFVRDAHNLYLETLGELGIPGLVLLLAALGGVFVIGIGKWRRAEGYERALLAAALAAGAAFATAAAIDWVWEMTVIPVALLLLAAAVLRTSAGGRRQADSQTGGSDQSEDRARRSGAGLAGGDRDADAGGPRGAREPGRRARGRLDSALDAARSAERFEGFAATPSLQRALVLEAMGDLEEAAAAAREATREESTNWRTWLTLSRIEAERGQAGGRRRRLSHRALLSTPARLCSQAAAARDHNETLPDARSRERRDPRAGSWTRRARAAAGDGEAARAGAAAAAAGVQGAARQAAAGALQPAPSACDC